MSRMYIPWKLLRDWGAFIGLRVVLFLAGGTVVFQGIDAFENLREYTAGGASGRELAIWFLLRTPELAQQILPAALLLGVLVGTFALARSRELTAAEASGLHPVWLWIIVALLGGGVACGQMLSEASWLPALRHQADVWQAMHIDRNPLRLDQRVRWMTSGADLWRIERFDDHYTFEIYQRREGAHAVIRLEQVVADGDRWQVPTARRSRWPDAVTWHTVEPPTIPFLPAELAPVQHRLRYLGLGALWREMRAKSRLGGEVSGQELEWHQRISWALMSLTVLLAVLPFIPRHGRSASVAAGALLALLIGIIGWAAIVFGSTWATSRRDVLGYWIPHGVLVLTATVGWIRIRGETVQPPPKEDP
ncbi:MAG: LptF/LptG family permease [Candidatus Dadabacteria bacterium]|nr:MAG: LptF/LptG family permease [Candidatus Dadabacteria bacterium]